MLPGDLDLEWLGPFPVIGEYEHGRARCQCAGHVDFVSEGAVVGPWQAGAREAGLQGGGNGAGQHAGSG